MSLSSRTADLRADPLRRACARRTSRAAPAFLPVATVLPTGRGGTQAEGARGGWGPGELRSRGRGDSSPRSIDPTTFVGAASKAPVEPGGGSGGALKVG